MTTSAKLYVKPSWQFICSHLAHFIAFGFGSGLSPVAPGTVGTLVAFPVYWSLAGRLNEVLFMGMVAFIFAVGVWACGRTGKTLGVADHGGMVWDEITAFLLVLFFTPEGLLWQLLAFLLFRFFDIVKPPPIRYFDRTWHGGFGVMFDDILAAGYAILGLTLMKIALQ
ncbi:MAG: phosphatidylglycerophosphatase A [Proteobacteria bacterium]|nr:phosphatidylglycerophosphatase A [Pseudomonadota bacterium]